MKVEFGKGQEKASLNVIAERARRCQPKPKITYKMMQERAREINITNDK